MNKTYTSAIEAIMDIENSMKKKKKSATRRAFGAVQMLLVLATVVVSLMVGAVPVSAVTKQNADDAYTKGNYQQAIADYQELLKSGEDVGVYYNLGNAYYRSDNIPQALLAYERALLLDPSDKAVKFNLDFVRSKTIDKVVAANSNFFAVAYRSVTDMTNLSGWTSMSVGTFIVALLLALAYLFGNAMWMRKAGFYGAVACLLLFAFSTLFAWQQHRRLVNRDGAIVTAPVVSVKKTPSASASDAFIVHEGTRVTITDSTMKDWCAVTLDDGREGWIGKKNIENI